jgi:hypothetical protein
MPSLREGSGQFGEIGDVRHGATACLSPNLAAGNDSPERAMAHKDWLPANVSNAWVARDRCNSTSISTEVGRHP